MGLGLGRQNPMGLDPLPSLLSSVLLPLYPAGPRDSSRRRASAGRRSARRWSSLPQTRPLFRCCTTLPTSAPTSCCAAARALARGRRGAGPPSPRRARSRRRTTIPMRCLPDGCERVHGELGLKHLGRCPLISSTVGAATASLNGRCPRRLHSKLISGEVFHGSSQDDGILCLLCRSCSVPITPSYSTPWRGAAGVVAARHGGDDAPAGGAAFCRNFDA